MNKIISIELQRYPKTNNSQVTSVKNWIKFGNHRSLTHPPTTLRKWLCLLLNKSQWSQKLSNLPLLSNASCGLWE